MRAAQRATLSAKRAVQIANQPPVSRAAEQRVFAVAVAAAAAAAVVAAAASRLTLHKEATVLIGSSAGLSHLGAGVPMK